MPLTRRQLLDIDNALAEIERHPGPVPFTLWVARCREQLAQPVAEIRQRGRLKDDLARAYSDYESARIVLARQHAAKDATTHRPIEDGSGRFVIADHGAFEAAVEALQKDQFAAVYAAVQAQRQEWERWVDDPQPASPPVALPSISAQFLPNTLTGALLRPLLPLVVDLPPTRVLSSAANARRSP